MAPSGRRRRRRSTRKPRRTQFKKLSKNHEEVASVDFGDNTSITSSDRFSKISNIDGDDDHITNGVDVPASGCSTPKGHRFQIPEILTCPPAPKKRRALPNCSIRRTPIAFFAPPEIEQFFLLALRHIPA
ncbi:Cyclin-dependent protein kinase [Actinidia chinensis var. chinensis]|uniref:Cyclin-dependent protein kinase n=1 Tax=Actinidia chinensis var. chinensis TaxID=1590841 RepID=A0A2R6QTX0_ACTCC|nr:Cyclin-dependent protein kinase [Actinidia chinensis var. chinensis]